MNHNPELMQAILDAPGNDAARLAYAAWLRDNGEPGYADFISLQIALQEKLDEIKPALVPEGHGGNRHDAYLRFMKQDCGFCDMEDQITQLLQDHGYKWMEPLAKALYLKTETTKKAPPRFIDDKRDYTPSDFTFIRGFVSHIRCPAHVWLANGDEAIKVQPIEAIILHSWDSTDSNLLVHKWMKTINPPIPIITAYNKSVHLTRKEALEKVWPRIQFTIEG